MSGIKGANSGEKCARYVHGETKTRLHKIWESMIALCEYEKHPYYDPDNGGCYGEYKKDKIEKLEKDETI